MRVHKRKEGGTLLPQLNVQQTKNTHLFPVQENKLHLGDFGSWDGVGCINYLLVLFAHDGGCGGGAY